jgi:ABC-type glutathione transport system ATPase component
MSNYLFLEIVSAMKNFERVANEILAYLNDGKTEATELLIQTGARFILCGSSGSGKTLAVNLANEQLPKGKKIAESFDMLFVKDLVKAKSIIDDRDLAYQDSKYIGFNVVQKDFARKLELNGEKVFWL